MAYPVPAGQVAPGAVRTLRGRRDECAVLDGLLEGARAGHSGALVVQGEAGVGKTELLEYAIGSASGFRIGRTLGVESERELAFAGLHQLCAPLLGQLDRLPGPQRDALAITFGMCEGAVPDRFFIGLAVLGLLSEVAEGGPLLCVVDDAQWLDQASTQTLGFVARRLLAESVVMLFGARDTGTELQGLDELVLRGLPEADARELLQSVIPWPLDERVCERIVAESRGNPLALLELPRGFSPAQLAGGFGLPGASSLVGRIEESFLARLEALPADARRLLLVAAAESAGDPALVWRAAGRLGIAVGPMLTLAESAGLLLQTGGRVLFRHPLVRSAVYRAATPEERREVHRALAEAADADADPDRRAWHLAEAAAGPDENVAAELERAAGRAQTRGGLAAAAAFHERATALTVDPMRRAERAMAGAQAKYEAGAFDDARALLAVAESDLIDDFGSARVHRLRAQIAFASRRGGDAPGLLLKAAQEFERVDVNLARRTYLEALNAALFAGRLARDGGVVEVSKAALACPSPRHSRRPLDLLLDGLAIRFARGYAAGAPVVKEALGAFRRETSLPPQEARWLWLASWAAGDVWDDGTFMLLSSRQLELVRQGGAMADVPSVPYVLDTRGLVHVIAGELDAAASLFAEMRALTDATGIPTSPYGLLWLTALRGREDELSALVETTVSDAVTRGEGRAPVITEFARALLYNGLGRYDEAVGAIGQPGNRPSDMGLVTRGVAELVEAAARSGKPELAAQALERLAETTRASMTDWGLGVEARSRALLRDGNAAEGLYGEAIERLERTGARLDLARAHLLYGEWLRRERRRQDAREALRTAHEMLMAMGAEAFAQRAARELLATGERVRKRVVETREDLTPHETQIAQLVCEGLSNPEIGARLFISPRTVEYHLHKVFNKLGISSRNELRPILRKEPGAALAS